MRRRVPSPAAQPMAAHLPGLRCGCQVPAAGRHGILLQTSARRVKPRETAAPMTEPRAPKPASPGIPDQKLGARRRPALRARARKKMRMKLGLPP